MQPLARYGAREASKAVFRQHAVGPQVARFGSVGPGKGREAASWTCQDCLGKLRRNVQQSRWQDSVLRRTFTSSRRRCEDDDLRKPLDPPATTSPSTSPAQPTSTSSPAPPPRTETLRSPAPSVSPTRSQPNDTLSTPASTSSSLPSRFASRRHRLSQNLAKLADNLLSKASLASQQLNTYTGTDFSGIEALRSEITAQEENVKSRHVAVSEAKDRHVESHAKQAASQKEIVGLLERKSSWGPTDLERYMSLVRSEHLDEQGVATAKNELADAERELEDSRALLERLERKQYHEEQIWSDTIRRNSTWVTIGLMGVNILLLLANIAVFEPWRRRRIVREVKAALDEKSISHPVPAEKETPAVIAAADVPTAAEPKTEAVTVKEVLPQEELGSAPVVADTAEKAGETPLAAGEVLPEEAAKVSEPVPESPSPPLARTGSYEEVYETYRLAFLDLFSERLVELKKVDVTTIALQGAASGVAVMGFLFLVLRPK